MATASGYAARGGIYLAVELVRNGWNWVFSWVRESTCKHSFCVSLTRIARLLTLEVALKRARAPEFATRRAKHKRDQQPIWPHTQPRMPSAYRNRMCPNLRGKRIR